MFGKLFIYDASTPEDRDQAAGRFSKSDGVTTIGTQSKTGLLMELNELVRKKSYFSRVLVQTHGTPGSIEFNKGKIFDTTLKSDFVGWNFHALFPLYTRIYFDGCNVAEGSLGSDFLDAVGSIFLRSGGGEVYGWTSYGYGMSSWIPFIGGHTVHFSGDVKRAYFGVGGVKIIPPSPPRAPAVERERPERGFKV